MQLPFNLAEVRMVCIDGDRVRFVLPDGHIDVVINSRSRKTNDSAGSPSVSRTHAAHIMFEDGIYGI